MEKKICKDCIHFKICNDYVHLVGREDKIACPDFKSIADVVPRSDFDELNKMYREAEQKYFEAAVEMIDQAEQEVARKIIEEIEKFISSEEGTITSSDKFEQHIYNAGVDNAKFVLKEEIVEELKKKYIESSI